MSNQNIEDIINNEIIDNTVLMLSNDKITHYNLTNRINHKKIFHIMWHILHSFSIQYPENPNEDEKNRVKLFIKQFKKNMPFFCSTCGGNKKDIFIENYDLDLAVSSKTNLIQFFCDYHIEINTKYRNSKEFYNQDIYNIDFIVNRYSDNYYSNYIENKYNVNLFTLFLNDKMDNFFTVFNTDIIKDIREEKFGVKITIFKEI